MIVAVDGPAGAGKSTVARRVAEDLGFAYMNTGAMYRALAVAAQRRGVDPGDAAGVARLAESHRVELRFVDGRETVFLDDEDVSVRVREPAVSAVVSQVAAHPPLREIVVRWQRTAMQTGDWVADGRDIGSVVAPDADVKVFLTASPEERARRRHAELVETGDTVTLGEVHADMRARDERDATREVSPLVVADGAVVLDTTDLTIDEVIGAICDLVRDRSETERGIS